MTKLTASILVYILAFVFPQAPSSLDAAQTSLIPACPKCAAQKQFGKLTCCARGGSWFQKCGNDSNFDHTWSEGIQACKGQARISRIPSTIISPMPVCPKCGVHPQSGEPNCCARGGAWFGTCGDPSNSNFDHTWTDGMDACKASAAISRIRTTATNSCPICGVNKNTGKGNCCARGGSWFQKCGDEGDTKSEHTWSEGVLACSYRPDARFDLRYFEGAPLTIPHLKTTGSSSGCARCGRRNYDGGIAPRLSCCHPDGSWSGNCGDPGDWRYAHTWDEGIQACKANTCRRCIQLGGVWQIAIGCGTCIVSMLGRCFESCGDYDRIQKQLKVCRAHQSCRVCMDAGCDWYPHAGGKCTVDYGQSMAFVDTCPANTAATTPAVQMTQVTTSTTDPACTRCGANNYQLSCCHPGGSWYGKCGGPGDRRYAHTWDEGVRECRVKSCAACINLGGLWQIGMGCGACSIPDAGRCFRSCEELSRIQKRMEQCGKHQSCRACKDAGCDWFEGSYKDGCTVQYGQFMFFVPACPPTIAAAPVTTTTMDPVCKRCGDHEPTGALSYHLSCCNFGGSWFGNCGSPGDRRYQFSWDDGIQACKAENCDKCIQMGGGMQIGLGCSTCYMAGRCFRSCEDYDRTRNRIKVCEMHRSCRRCKNAGCDWYTLGGGKCSVDYGQTETFIDACPTTTVSTTKVTTPSTTTSDPPCTRCGDRTLSGFVALRLSCCLPGGSWYGKCGDPGDRRYAHTWDEGVEFCKAETCAQCIALGGGMQIGLGCGTCNELDAGRCFRSCQDYGLVQKRLEVCATHKSCSDCMQGDCKWFQGWHAEGGGKCTVYYGQFMLFVQTCPTTVSTSTVITSSTTTQTHGPCTRCGSAYPYGIGLSCCHRGGSWYHDCGDPGDSRFQHTWDDGIEVCKVTTCLQCVRLGGSWEFSGACSTCLNSGANPCFRTIESCAQYEQLRKVRKKCAKQINCHGCHKVDYHCRWVNSRGGFCTTNAIGAGFNVVNGCPAFGAKRKQTTSAVLLASSVTTTLMPRPSGSECSRCAIHVGKLSCCARGGSWYGECSDPGDTRYAHTWDEGVEACKAETCSKCVEIGGIWQVGECTTCEAFDMGFCYETQQSCSFWDKLEEAIELCQQQQSCHECIHADPRCIWWTATNRCTGYLGNYVNFQDDIARDTEECATTTTAPYTGSFCPVCGGTARSGKRSCCSRGGSWFGKCGDQGNPNFEHNWIEGTEACRDATMPTTTTTPLCPICGVNKKSGKGNCCARGGSWFQKCGDEGNNKFDHTWAEGFDACSDFGSEEIKQARVRKKQNSSLVDVPASIFESAYDVSTANMKRCDKLTTFVPFMSVSIIAVHV